MWPNPQFPADLVKFTEEIFNEKLDFLCSVHKQNNISQTMKTSTIIITLMIKLKT